MKNKENKSIERYNSTECLDKYYNSLKIRRLKFIKFKVNDIVFLKSKYRNLNQGADSHLFVKNGKIVFANNNTIIVEDLEKSYKKFTIDINSFLIGDIIINKLII